MTLPHDVVWNALIAGAVTLTLSWMGHRAAAKAKITLDKIETVGKQTHVLVNSNMGVQLKLNAITSRRLANLTKDTEDEAAAELASKLYNDHQAKQAVVDSGKS